MVLLVGHQARAGSFPGIMARTVSYERFRAVRVEGRDSGETEIFAMRAGELGELRPYREEAAPYEIEVELREAPDATR